MNTVVSWLEHRQIGLYLVAIAAAGVIGLTVPGAHHLEGAIEPVLALLLFATFLGVPFAAIGKSLRDGRFLAAAPLLMLAQILLLPLYLLLFIGPEGVAVVDVGPFARAFLLLIVVPLTAAALVQVLARRYRSGVVIERTMLGLMMATLFTVVASQAGAVGDSLGQILVLVPIYAGFLGVMAALGIGAGRIFRLDAPATRALVFSGATRNSLVVLPLALALPASLSLAPVVVVAQTLVELIGMVIFVRLIPRLIPNPRRQIEPRAAEQASR